MEVIFTKRFPFKGFRAISLFGRMYVRDPKGNTKKWMIECPERYYKILEHERTHWEQQKEMLVLPFFIWYGVEWFVKVFTEGKAYKNVGFEREARDNEYDTDEYALNIVFHHGKHLTISRFNLCREEYVSRIDFDSIKHIEFIPLGFGGSLTYRKHFQWFKYMFHRTMR